MSRHYLVISDLHLCDLEDHDDGWKAYKSSRFLFDDDLAALVEHFTSRFTGHGTLLLLLNGDIFDFDLVTAVPSDPVLRVSRAERRSGLNPTAEKSAWKLGRMLAQHPRFVETLARFLAAGHRVVYLLGNHDREFHFPAVQQVLLDSLRAHPLLAARALDDDALRFEPWFFYAPGEIYAEHGHQFDYYSAFKNQLEPTIDSDEGAVIALPMGNLSNRCLMTRMGFFNPYASDFVLNFFRYITHWVKHYLFSVRSLLFTWLGGSLHVIAGLLAMKRKLRTRHGPHGEQLEILARRYGLPAQTLKQINRLHERPIFTRFYRVVREFWLDRVLIMLAMVGGSIILALLPVPVWVKVMVPLCTFPLIFSIYEWLARGETIFAVDHHLPECARNVAELVKVRVVTFGHTHRARLLPLTERATFVDTGAWAPITERTDMNRLARGMRNYLIVSFTDDGERIELGARS